MTATWLCFWKTTTKPLNSSNNKFLNSRWLIETTSYKKIKSGSSHVTHHTSHITNCMWNCKFYKIFRIIVVVHFGKSFKLNLNKFMKYFFIKIIVLTKQTPRSSTKLLKLNILWGKKISSKKLGFPEKS
mgnify:FL=1